ncbi:6-phosphogluconolactonase [Desulfovibrio litoralis]|uniref:6-phosphogluconolactonase n=1 Tax=Desulfovibrio litoralis DSM 11393 TaxID=1121455 RepID=A0A1M7SML4_9BACT|nr:6-phosphogluconolactonase [Desulfovibrio litoralis]SHN59683.1 6-phosphogluconolactonase [Desulfovibrio litoralis DSM 11393]
MIRKTQLALYVAEDTEKMAEQAAELIEAKSVEAIKERGIFNIALSGGSTPLPLFRLLSSSAWRKRINWDKTAIYWVDERCYGPDHEQSNYRRAKAELLSNISSIKIYRMRGEEDPVKAALDYENMLKEHFNCTGDEIPRFDCVILGVGEDGHVASLYPNMPGLKIKNRLIVDQYVPSLHKARLTMTLELLNNSRCCIFLASGKKKYHVLETALNLMKEPVLPAQMVRPYNGSLCWIIDEAAYRGEKSE